MDKRTCECIVGAKCELNDGFRCHSGYTFDQYTCKCKSLSSFIEEDTIVDSIP